MPHGGSTSFSCHSTACRKRDVALNVHLRSRRDRRLLAQSKLRRERPRISRRSDLGRKEGSSSRSTRELMSTSAARYLKLLLFSAVLAATTQRAASDDTGSTALKSLQRSGDPSRPARFTRDYARTVDCRVCRARCETRILRCLYLYKSDARQGAAGLCWT